MSLKIKLDEVFNDKTESNMSFICSNHNGDVACVDGIPNDVKNEYLQALNETKQNKITRLEKELSKCKSHLKTKIDNLLEKLLVHESGNRRTIMEYQLHCGRKTLHEIRQNEVTRLEKKLLDNKTQSKGIIDHLRKKLLMNEIGNNRIGWEYRRQCENLKENNNHLKTENLILRQKLETAEISNIELIKINEKNRIQIQNLEEQLTSISLSNNLKQIENDLKKKQNQEGANLLDQHKCALHHMKSKDCHYTSLTNELTKLRHDHQNMIMENNNLISKLTQKLQDTQKNELSNNFNNYNNDILNLINQLVECSKHNQLLNDLLQKLTVENEQLCSTSNHTPNHMDASRVSDDNHCTNNARKLEDDYQNSLKLLQKKKDAIKKLTEILSTKSRIIDKMKEKEAIYEHFRRKIQLELEKYSRDKSYVGERSDHNGETLGSALEILLTDTLSKLIQTEEYVSMLPIELTGKSMPTNESSIKEHNMHSRLSLLENVIKQKDEEMEKLRNQIEEHTKEMDELKQLYVEECSEKEKSLNDKERLEKLLDTLSAQFKTLNDEFGKVVEEKGKLTISLIGINKEMTTNQIHKKSLEKKFEKLENKLKMRECQKEMIVKLKVDLNECKESVLSTRERLKFRVDSEIATYKDQLDELKKQYDKKVQELTHTKENILKINNSDLPTLTKLID